MSKIEWNNPKEPPPAYSLHQHACLSLNSSDCFRLIRFPPTIIPIIRQAIITSWPRGIQREEDYSSAYEFKLYGNPWWGQGGEAIPARILMIHVLSVLYHHGWHLLTSTDISKKEHDKDSLIFQLGVPPPQTSFFAISFNEFDKLRLICAPHELDSAVQRTLGPANIQGEEWRDNGLAYQFKLCGFPWHSGGSEGIHTRIQLLSLLDCFTTFGWKLYTSIDMSRGTNHGSDADTWFFCREIH